MIIEHDYPAVLCRPSTLGNRRPTVRQHDSQLVTPPTIYLKSLDVDPLARSDLEVDGASLLQKNRHRERRLTLARVRPTLEANDSPDLTLGLDLAPRAGRERRLI